MLIWKTQTLDANLASLRYRCLLPFKYLARKGISQHIYGGTDPVKLTANTDAIVFVKSFRDEDVETCDRAAQLGVPIILDLCDNIFIPDYAADSRYVPADNFRQMAQKASAIVATGTTLKAAIETAIAPLNTPVVVIPDGCETQADLSNAFRITWWMWLRNQASKMVSRRSLSIYQICRKQIHRLIHQIYQKQIYQKAKRRVKNGVVRLKIQVKQNMGKQEVIQPHKQSVASKPSADNQTTGRIIVQPTPIFPQRWPKAQPGTKTILWFGNHGAKYGSFGMSSILQVAPAIEQLSRELPLRLVVVSNSQTKYERYIEPLPFETLYLRWHPQKSYDYIRASDVVIVPNSQSIFSICKSANRVVLALSQGTPVVASRTPSLDLLQDCVVLDDWYLGLRQYLIHPAIAQAHVAAAQRAIAQNFSGDKIAQQWLALIENISNAESRHPSARPDEVANAL